MKIFRTEMMNWASYSEYMSGGYNYTVMYYDVEAETKEEAIAIAKKDNPDYYINTYARVVEKKEYTTTEKDRLIARIAELENTLKIAVVLSKDQIKHNTVSLGTSIHVHIVEPDFEEDADFDIVGSNEANPMEGRISDESPVGKALVGHMVGETVEVETTYGLTTYEILAVAPTA